MGEGDLLLAFAVAGALVFLFTNGLHDAATVVSASISTGALTQRAAIVVAAGFAFVGALLSLEVARTVATGLFEARLVSVEAVLGGVAGAVSWNVVAWSRGWASSSSHALLGGLLGSVLAAAGPDALIADGLLGRVAAPALVVPVLAFGLGAGAVVVAYRLAWRARPGAATRGFRLGQLGSGSLLALAHGMNDAQKAMGVIVLALIAHGSLEPDGSIPAWVVITAAATIAAGLLAASLGRVRTRGARIVELDAAQGLCAQGSSAAAILAASYAGIPLSTTQAISGGTAGAGAGRRPVAVRVRLAASHVAVSALTVPAVAAVGAAAYGLTALLGWGLAGPAIVLVAGAALAAPTVRSRLRAVAVRRRAPRQ